MSQVHVSIVYTKHIIVITSLIVCGVARRLRGMRKIQKYFRCFVNALRTIHILCIKILI